MTSQNMFIWEYRKVIPGVSLFMYRDCPLEQNSEISLDDLIPYSIFCSEQSIKTDLWEKSDQLQITAIFSRSNNVVVFVREGPSITITSERLIETHWNENAYLPLDLHPCRSF